MSVSETYRARIAVARGWKADPGPDRSPKSLKTNRRVYAENALLNALLVFVHERQRLRRTRPAHVRESMPALVEIRICGVGPAVHEHAQGHAASPGQLTLIPHLRFVRRAFVDADRAVVWEEQAVLDVGQRRVGKGISLEPGWSPRRPSLSRAHATAQGVECDVRRQGIQVVVGMHEPAKLELTEVAQTAGGLRFGLGLGLGQRR